MTDEAGYLLDRWRERWVEDFVNGVFEPPYGRDNAKVTGSQLAQTIIVPLIVRIETAGPHPEMLLCAKLESRPC